VNSLESIHDTIARVAPEVTAEQRQPIVAALVAREESMADMMRMAGLQFGLYPQIVSEVFAEIGVGEPISEQQRTMIRSQFTALMEDLQRQHGEQS
jgi:hypothetical protein